MQLYILGKNTDDKGTQLEQLTERLLNYQGLDNIQLSVIGTGGNEVDVTAYHKVTIGLKQQTVKVIVECKAHQTDIDMTDWLKFKGKYWEEQKKNPHAMIKVKSDIIITHHNEERCFHTHSKLVLAKLEGNEDNVILLESVLD